MNDHEYKEQGGEQKQSSNNVIYEGKRHNEE